MYSGSFNGGKSNPPGPKPTSTDPPKKRPSKRKGNSASSTPYGFSNESLDGHAADPDGVKRAGDRAANVWGTDPSNRDQNSESQGELAECHRRQAHDQRRLDRWTQLEEKANLIRRRAVGEPEFWDHHGRLKLDAIKALLLAIAVTVLLLTEFFGATSLTQAAPWFFINESWGRAALLTFPFVVAGYVQLRNAVKSLRGRHKKTFLSGLLIVGVLVAVLGLLCLGISLGDVHRETDGLRPDAPLVPYAVLTCLSMLGAALSLVVVESWLQQKIEACRRYVETINPAYERAATQVARLLNQVSGYDRRVIKAECDLESLAKDRTAWVNWAESEVRRRQHEAAARKQRDTERRRLLESKQRAETELNAFES